MLNSGLEFGFNANMKYSTKYKLNDVIPDAYQPDYETIDAGVYLSSPDKGWKLALVGRNLTDEYVQTRGTDAPSTGGGTGTEAGFKGDRYAYVKPGRTVALKLSYQR